MENKNLKYKHIYFIGIGGISQSALATICLSEGIKVSGSDREKSDITEHLKRLGVNIYYSHNGKNIQNVDLVVYSGAIPSNNEEIMQAQKDNIPLMERAEFLGVISSMYKKVIAVSGIHGKTTTTGMLAVVFTYAKLNPTVHIGGEIKNFDSNSKIGSKEYFITEACEYRESFLKLNPNTSIILNIEEDHPDYYKNLSQILKAFENFSLKSQNIVIGESYKSLISRKDIISFSIGGKSDYIAKNIKKMYGVTSFSVYKKGKFWGNVKLRLMGEHNVYNALSVIAVSEIYGISKSDIIGGLWEYLGVKRRFDFWKEYASTMVFHDYAHHPTEIKSVIKMCKEYFNLPIICYFQPHTYSRTKTLFSEFLSAFDECEETFILPTYSARENANQGYSGQFLAKNLKLKNIKVKYLKKKESAVKSIKGNYGKKCIILVLGAGDIYKIKNSI